MTLHWCVRNAHAGITLPVATLKKKANSVSKNTVSGATSTLRITRNERNKKNEG
jgi:hypothetical protein